MSADLPVRRWWPVHCLALCLGVLLSSSTARAQDDQPPPPDGQFLTLQSPIDDEDFGLVSRYALKLQSQADREKRKVYLVLEIPDGASQFHQVYGLASFLTSTRLPDVTVVAWLPETVTGYNVAVALAANEIVMAPDAEIGDIGRGKPLEAEQRKLLLDMVDKGRNPFLSKSIVDAMLDPAADLQRVKVETTRNGMTSEETRFLSSAEIRKLHDDGAVTPEVSEIKPAGGKGVFSGRKLKQLGMLISQTAESRTAVSKLYQLPAEALEEVDGGEQKLIVRRVRLEGPIFWDTEFQLSRQIDRALEEGANLIVLEIDSPGGELGATINLADKLIGLADRDIRTIAYIPREAISGGAIVALACDEIYMHPDAAIGDAGPIEMRDGGQFEHVPEKFVSRLRETMRDLAEKKGRPPALLMSMIDRHLPVYKVTDRDSGRVWYATQAEIDESGGKWIRGEMVEGTKDGLFLTVNGAKAEELLLAESPVQSVDDLQQRLGLPLDQPLDAMQVQWVDNLLIMLNTRAAMFLLFVGGIACLYLELHLPTGFFGILSALCFVLFFWARFVGGSAGWLEVMLFLLGIACILLEIFVIPGVGVVGIGGGVLVIVSLVMASQTFSGMEGGDATEVMKTLGTLAGAGVTVIAFAVVMSHFLPRMPLLNKLILMPPGVDEDQEPGAPRLRPQLAEESPYRHLLGKRGTAISLLKPFGKARIEGELLEVTSDGTLIDPQTEIEVVEVAGRKIVVREAGGGAV